MFLDNYNRATGAAGGRTKKRFQQSASTDSGAGEKETLNINVVGKNKYSYTYELFYSLYLKVAS